jgi:hypothetical protein
MDKLKGPKDNVKSGLVIGGWPPKKLNGPPYFFEKTSNNERGVERRRCKKMFLVINKI